MDSNELKDKCKHLKVRMLEMCVKAGVGHVTSALSCAEILTALYYNIMHIDKSNPNWNGRDRMILSKNHASIMTYPIFADLGWISDKDLDEYMQDNSLLGTHGKMEIPGMDFSGGALGIGLGVACGMAYAAKTSHEAWKAYCIIGDGECYEGAIWESAMFAGHYHLSNLVVFLDNNGLCMTDYNEKLLTQEPMADKWQAFGWYVDSVDGHNIQAIIDAVHKAEADSNGKPVMIICKTLKGHGISFMENKLFVHGVTPKGDKAERALNELRGDD